MGRALLAAVAFAPLVACTALVASPPAADLVIRDVTVIDTESGAARPRRTVLIQKGRVAAILPAGARARARRSVDGRGKYLVPGFWDAHTHLSYAGSCALPVMVAHGVTSVRDLGGRPEHVKAWREQMAGGALTGPTIKTAGPTVEATRWVNAVEQLLRSEGELERFSPFDAVPRLRAGSPAEARAVVDQLAAMGVDVIKFRNLAGDDFRALADQARLRNLPVAGHSASGLTPADAAEAGQGSVEHGETLSNRFLKTPPAERDVQLRRMAAAGTLITPTLVADYVRVATDEQQQAALDNPPPEVSVSLQQMWRFGFDTRRFNDKRDWNAFYKASAADLRAADAAGVRMMVGTDLGVILVRPGLSVHEEMALMADRLEMSPAEVLKAATVNPARFFDASAKLLVQGAPADLVLLNRNPLEDIAATRSIEAVVLRGKLLDRTALDTLLAGVHAAVAAKRECSL